MINNILMVKAGDENFCSLRTEGLGKIYSTFKERIQNRVIDGQKPFSHIKAWYNLVAYSAWDFGSCWASCESDITEHARSKLPQNTEFIGVDTYDYWWSGIPFDPIEPANRSNVLARVAEWHRIRTQYYPEGLATSVCKNSKDPATWTPECWSDTHALENAIKLAEADKGMMIYIALSSSLKGHYTTPTETMDAYYDNCKAGPWVGLVWWTSVGKLHPKENPLGTLGYIDKTLVHYTPENPKGKPYTPEQLETLRKNFIDSRKRMFNDVVYRQFGFINKKPTALKKY